MGKKVKEEPKAEEFEVQIETGKVEDHYEPVNLDVVQEEPVIESEHFNAFQNQNVELKDPSHSEPQGGVEEPAIEEKPKVKEEDLKPQAEGPLPGRPEPKDPSHLLPQAEAEPKKVEAIDPKHLKPQE